MSMITFSKYLKESVDWRTLDEAGMSRLLTHLDNRNVGIITAFRGGSGEQLEVNLARNRELQAEIRKAGFGYLRLEGHYVENEGTPEETPVEEQSFFVIGSEEDDNGKLKGFLRSMMKKYQQESAIFKPWNSTTTDLIFRDNPAESMSLGTFSMDPKNIRKMYSTFKGRDFVFHRLSEQRSFMSRLAHQKGYQAQKTS